MRGNEDSSSAYRNSGHSLTTPKIAQGKAKDLFSKFSSFREETHKQFSTFINAHSENINKGLNSLVEEVCQLQTQVLTITNEKNVLQTWVAMITNEKTVLHTQVSIITNEKNVLLETVANLNAEVRQLNAKLPVVTDSQKAKDIQNQATQDAVDSKEETPDPKKVDEHYAKGTTITDEIGDDEENVDFSVQTSHQRDKYTLNGQNQHTKDKPTKRKENKWMTVEACKICGKVYQRCHLYLCHYLVHSDKKEFECSLCSKFCETPSDLKEHMKVHGADKKFWHCCELCDKHFTNKTKFEVHIGIHNGFKPFPCDLCNKSFVQKSNMDEHRRIHTGEKPFICELCAAAFCRRSGKREYQVFHSLQSVVL